MAIPAILAPLLANGLNLVANAVMAKGKDYVEKKLGVELKPDMSPDDLAKVQIAQMEHEEELLRIRMEEKKLDIEAFKAEAEAVSQRWVADMSSDSWLSKNIRPMTLIALLCDYFMFFVYKDGVPDHCLTMEGEREGWMNTIWRSRSTRRNVRSCCSWVVAAADRNAMAWDSLVTS